MVNKRRGRPRGETDTRDRIISAAREQFLEHGYARATLRKIAAEAGVDHTLVNYYFGTKENLFSESVLGGFSPSVVFKTVRAPQDSHSQTFRGYWHVPLSRCAKPLPSNNT